MQEKIEGYIAITIDVPARPNELKAPLVNQVGARLYKTRASCEAELIKRLPKLEGYQSAIDRGVGNNLFLYSLWRYFPLQHYPNIFPTSRCT